jgi:hypothetical protein
MTITTDFLDAVALAAARFPGRRSFLGRRPPGQTASYRLQLRRMAGLRNEPEPEGSGSGHCRRQIRVHAATPSKAHRPPLDRRGGLCLPLRFGPGGRMSDQLIGPVVGPQSARPKYFAKRY